MSNRRIFNHESDCDAIVYEGGTCTCDMLSDGYSYDGPVYGEDPHDGRLAGPAMDW